MINFLLRKPAFKTVLFLVWGIPFLFLPFYHYHPDNTHSHAGELAPHKHAGHSHSHEIESLAHFINLHPEDAGLDEKRHHSHSSPEHDTDDVQFDFYKTKLPSTKQTSTPNPYDLSAPLVTSEPGFSLPLSIRRWSPAFPDLSIFPKERSPPTLLL